MKKIKKLKIKNKLQNLYYINNPKQFNLLFDIVSNNLKSYTIKLRSQQCLETLTWIYAQTQILDRINARLKTRIYWIFNNIHKYPKCANQNCSNILGEIQNISDGYNGGYCSRHCAKSDPIRILHKQQKFEKKHGKGITCPQKLPNVKKKISDSLSNMSLESRKHVNESIRQTWLSKSKEQIDQIVIQRKKTSLDKYGVEVPSQTINARKHLSKIMASEDVQQKIISTKKRNGTINSSKLEDDVYKKLCMYFSQNDIIRQYRSDVYPFNCDFYIKSLDTYIECNFNWTHGGHWFNANSKEDQEKLKIWKNKGTKFYMTAIDVWTNRDQYKLKIANDNHLKYIVFWKPNELDSWILSLQLNNKNNE